MKWSITTWSVKTKRSHILKLGTEEDKGRLPDATYRNVSRSSNQRRNRGVASNVLHTNRQRRIERENFDDSLNEIVHNR